MTRNSASEIQIHQRPHEPSMIPAAMPLTSRSSRPIPATASDHPDRSRIAASLHPVPLLPDLEHGEHRDAVPGDEHERSEHVQEDQQARQIHA